MEQPFDRRAKHCLCAGEVSASHGVYRPGGSALNAGQAGSTRAAQFIARNRGGEPVAAQEFAALTKTAAEKAVGLGKAVHTAGEKGNVKEIWNEATRLMSGVGGAIRAAAEIDEALKKTKNRLEGFRDEVKAATLPETARAYRLYDVLICQYVYLSAMSDYVRNGGKSRGSAMYYDENGLRHYPELPEMFRFALDDGSRSDMVQEVEYRDGSCLFTWRKVREIPDDDDFFENVWRSYRENGNVY